MWHGCYLAGLIGPILPEDTFLTWDSSIARGRPTEVANALWWVDLNGEWNMTSWLIFNRDSVGTVWRWHGGEGGDIVSEPWYPMHGVPNLEQIWGPLWWGLWDHWSVYLSLGHQPLNFEHKLPVFVLHSFFLYFPIAVFFTSNMASLEYVHMYINVFLSWKKYDTSLGAWAYWA